MKIIGTFGDIIFYKSGEDYFARTKPKNCRQTKATKNCSGVFGKANVLAGIFRRLLAPVLADATIMDNRNNLKNPLYTWLLTTPQNNITSQDNIPFITGYEFNKRSLLKERLRMPLQTERTAENNIIVKIPSFNAQEQIVAPSFTQTVQLTIVAGSVNLQNVSEVSSFETSLNIAYTNMVVPAQEIMLPVYAGTGDITIVAAALKYVVLRKNKMFVTTEQRWMPAEIICGMYN